MGSQGVLPSALVAVERRMLLVIVAVACSFFAVGVSDASADYIERGSYDEKALFSEPRKAAVEQTTGNLFVVNADTGRIRVFQPSGTELKPHGEGLGSELDRPYGIAIWESGGQTEVYVSDAGNERVLRYLSDEAEVPTFTLDPTYVSPGHGTGEDEVQSFNSAIALAPNGDLWIADSGADVVKRFDPSGAHVAGSNFDGSSSGAAFTGLRDIAVNSAGDVYVVDQTGNVEKQLGTSRALRFSAAGAHQATLTPVGPNERPANVAVNPADDSVVVSGEADAPRRLEAPMLYFFDSGNALLQELSTGSEMSSVQGLAFRPAAKDLLYVVRDYGEYFGIPGNGTPGIGIFEEASPPAATIGAVSDVTATEATIGGEIEPNGKPTNWKVEYKPVAALAWSASAVQSAGSGVGQVQVSRTLTGLDPGTEYVARIRATSSDGAATTAEVTFTTAAAAPTIVSQSATPQSESALLRARINPGGAETTYRFEYGPTEAYGSQTTEQTIPAGSDPATVSASISGLQPQTTYHYRVVAESANGSVEGPDQTFTTTASGENCPNAAYRTGASAALTDCRAYELVTPPDSQADLRIAGGPSTPDGSIVCFNTEDQLADSDPNGIKTADDGFCARRTADGWKTTWVTGPAPKDRIGSMGSNVYFLSPDGQRVVFGSDANILGRDYWEPLGASSSTPMSAYMWEAGKTTWLSPPPPPVGDPPSILPEGKYRPFGPGSYAIRRPIGASEDLRHGIFESDLPILPQDQNELVDVYEWYPGGLRIVSRDNWGRAVGGQLMLHNVEQYEAPPYAVSADGDRIFFAHAGPINGLPAPSGVLSVYMREGDVLKLVSARSGTGPDADVRFTGASADGDTVYLDSVQQLTPQPKEDGLAIYRYDVSEDELELVADAPGGVELLDSSRDGSTFVYFERESSTLIVNRNGEDTALGTLGFMDTAQFMFYVANERRERRALRLTADGRVVVFTATGEFAGSSPGLAQVYRWEAGEGLENISAPANGPATANASIGVYSHQFPGDPREEFLHFHRGKTLEGRVISDDGSRIFFETPQALVARDVNEATDVYEWHDGEVNLVSPGTGGKSLYHESSADGRTVFFQTFDRLIPELDQNPRRDLYVAQPGGGFDPPAPPPSCEGDACQPQVSAPAPQAPAADGGEGNLPPAPKLVFGKQQLAELARRGKATIAVRVAAPGRVTAVLKATVGGRRATVGKASKSASGPGVVRLTLELSKKARRQLAKSGKLGLTLQVTHSGQTVRKGVMLRD